MPWESGPRGRPYYTRTRRENGRVIREYIGVGQEGQRAAEEDETRRRQAEADREADRALADEIRSWISLKVVHTLRVRKPAHGVCRATLGARN